MQTLRERYPLDKKKPFKKTLDSLFNPLLPLILIFIIGFIFIYYTATNIIYNYSLLHIILIIIIIFICTLVLFMILKYIYEIYYLKSYFYDVDDDNLIIRKGVFSKNEITLPINRIQDVYVDQDIFDRIFGLYDVHVSSATIISANLSHIDGLDKINSEAIKKLILSGIHKNG